MNDRLLHFYRRELSHLRDLGGEFAAAYPQHAARLGLSATECNDPFVERLLEGFAFLTARVQLKLDDEFPRFVETMLDSVYPHALAPLPSMTIVQFTPKAGLAQPAMIPRGTKLLTTATDQASSECQYRTAQDVTLWPLKVVEAQLLNRGLSELGLNLAPNVTGVIRLKLALTADLPLNKLGIDRLCFHLQGQSGVPTWLYEQVFSTATELLVRGSDAVTVSRLAVSSVGPVGFTADEALLPVDDRCFEGYRLLQEYFALPQRFLFFELTQLRDAISQCAGNTFEILLPLAMPKHSDADAMASRIGPASFRLHCTPAINLFCEPGVRVEVSDRQPEHHIVIDRTAPRNFEVHHLTRVNGWSNRTDGEKEFHPFFTARDDGNESGRYYALHRRERLASERTNRALDTAYRGSELFIALVDGKSSPVAGIKDLRVDAWCTNRHLPLSIRVQRQTDVAGQSEPDDRGPSDFTVTGGEPVKSIHCVGPLTAPQPARSGGSISWKLLNQLRLNYLSLVDSGASQGAVTLREMLLLHANNPTPAIRHQIEGVKSIWKSTFVTRLQRGQSGPFRPPPCFVNGMEIGLLMDETPFEPGGAFLLATVLNEFFSAYVSVNSITRTVLKSEQRGPVKTWPAQSGSGVIL